MSGKPRMLCRTSQPSRTGSLGPNARPSAVDSGRLRRRSDSWSALPPPGKVLLAGSMVVYIHACTYVAFDEPPGGAGAGSAATFNPGRAPRAVAGRVVGVGCAGPVPLRLRQPGARTGGARGRLHARRPLPPVQGQGGPGAGGARVGQPDLVARGRRAGRATARSGRRPARAGARSRRLLPT